MLRHAVRLPIAAACLVLAAASLASAAPGPSRVVTATPRDGVRLIGDLRVGPLTSERILTLDEVRAVWGPERRLWESRCVASWGTGVRLLFTSFGGPSACSQQSLQQAKVVGPRWKVQIGRRRWAIGDPRSSIPAGARVVPYQGHVLATMPFVMPRTPTVMAHVGRDDRIDRFTIFIGGAGD